MVRNKITQAIRVVCILVCVALITPASAHSEDMITVQVPEEKTVRVPAEAVIDLWHSSGSYWTIGNAGSSKIKVYDRDISQISDYLGSMGLTASYDIELPNEVTKAADKGNFLGWHIEKSYIALNELFERSTPENINLNSSELHFELKPRFNLSNYEYSDFVDGASDGYYLMDQSYGWNLYSVFGNGRSQVQGWGWFDSQSPSSVRTPYIHPSMIRDSSGEFRSGYSIKLGSGSYPSAGYKVGDGSFESGGAIGYEFRYIIYVVFRYTELVEKQVPAGQGSSPGAIGPGIQPDPGQQPTGGAIEPGADVKPQDEAASIKAVLDLPSVGYQGHPVTAVDRSEFLIGDTLYSAERAYRAGLGSGRISIAGMGTGTVIQNNYTSARLMFNAPGDYQVDLDISASGLRDKDSAGIKILKTPALSTAVGGNQKENRKQTLQIIAAQDPEHPIVRLYAELTELSTGEKIHVEKNFGSGEEERPENTDNIKYRSLTDDGSDKYYVLCTLEFLSKFSQTTEWTYTVFAQDDKGDSDRTRGSFTVAPDLPPEVHIGLEDAYYRDMGSNTAHIRIEDMSAADGDQLLREWSFDPAMSGSFSPMQRLAGYKDLSFGSGKTVSVDKQGVGSFGVHLKLTDVWTEETLPEYVSEADRKSAELSAFSHVDNIAPVVDVTLTEAKTMDLVLLAEDDRALEQLSAARSSLRASLMQKGYDADIIIARALAAGVSAEGEIFKLGQFTDSTLSDAQSTAGGGQFKYTHELLTSDFWGCSGGMEDGVVNPRCSASADGRYLYMMSSACDFNSMDSDINRYVRTYPYTIDCYDLRSEDRRLLWSTVISESVFPSPTGFKNAMLAHDEQGKYLYLISDGKTLLIDKQGGSALTLFPFALGCFNYASDQGIISLCSDGAYFVSSSGDRSEIWRGEIFAGSRQAALIGGKIEFLSRYGGGLCRCVLDPGSLAVSRISLSGSEASGPSIKLKCLAFDSSGRIVVSYGDSQLRCFDKDKDEPVVINAEVVGSVRSKSAVWDSSGRVSHVIYASENTTRSKSGTVYYSYINTFDLDNGTVSACQKRSEKTAPAYTNIIAYALEQRDAGRILASTGSVFEYQLFGSVTNTNPLHFTIKAAGGEAVSGTSSLADVPGAGHSGGYSDGGLQLIRAGMGNAMINSVALITETEEAERQRLFDKYADTDKDAAFCFTVGAGTDISALADMIIENPEPKAVMTLHSEASGGSASRIVKLEPSGIYYYEYDTTADRDILSAEAILLNQSALSGSAGGYKLREYHMEDLNDGNIDSFFSFSPGSIRDGVFRVSPSSVPGYQESTASFSFSVPEGCLGVLSFDYRISGADSSLNGADVLIGHPGKLKSWNYSSWRSELAACGTYHHIDSLEPGEYQVVFRLRKEANKHIESFEADNIELAVLDGSLSSSVYAAESLGAECSSVLSEDGEWIHVSGSFQTPESVQYYREYPCTYYYSEGSGSYSQLVRTYHSRYTTRYKESLSYTIPSGKLAAFVRVGTESSDYRECGDRYDNIVYSHDTGSRDEDGNHILKKWTVGRTGSSTATKLSFAQPGFELFRICQTGSTKYSCDPDHYENGHTWGGFSFTEMALVPVNCPQSVKDQDYVMQNGRMYLPDGAFDGSVRLVLCPGVAGDTAIRDLKIYRIEDGERVYAQGTDMSRRSMLQSWTADEAKLSMEAAAEEEIKEHSRIYKKGESVRYDISYYDYESDPSGASFWRYTHEPLNDGLNPISGQMLDSSVERFFYDGKYVLEHWQRDKAGRGSGISDYDKDSNVCVQSFYVIGKLATAPRIEEIRTVPAPVEEGDSYSVRVRVDDDGKNPLDLVIEIYYEDEAQPFGVKKVNDLEHDGDGVYPAVYLTGLPKAKAGSYQVVAIVSSDMGTGAGEYDFEVKPKRSLLSAVDHTESWDRNRIDYNMANLGISGEDVVSDPYEYMNTPLPRLRGKNVFWPGERLVLTAEIGGSPTSVSASLLGYPGASAVLRFKGKAGELPELALSEEEQRYIYTGELWDSSMADTLAKDGPGQETVRFTAVYADGEKLVFDVPIIFDIEEGGYWRIHRLF